MSKLPKFKYFKNPYTEFSIHESAAVCDCCAAITGYIFEHAKGLFCPWCIASGKAANTFGFTFINPSLIPDNIDIRIKNELTKKTPSFPTWQGIEWIFHCNDACVFEGDFSKEEAAKPDKYAVNNFFAHYHISIENPLDAWNQITSNYQIADPSMFKFSCRHCNRIFYTMDAH